MENGTLYGTGTGPGDPGLITLNAIRTIEKCDYIAVPNTVKEKALSYQIALAAVPCVRDKKCICVDMPMVKDKNILKESHIKAADKIAAILGKGHDISFLTLGDPSIYSTYIYIHNIIKSMGYQTEIISGVPSFCAASALLNEGLVTGSSELHIIPSSYGVDEALKLPGTKVLMKAGRKLPVIKEKLEQNNISAVLVENCGMENEHIYNCAGDIPQNAGYYSLVIIKED
ncbi:MAG: precorrin-2 C(20)-methyltransferase [Lachnospiraceae bacterium]|nr:precorrin-2 C(20)-methyltransferase [Lachnospiraceae bacterium]